MVDYRVNNKRSLRDVERRIRLHLEPVFGGRRMASITTADARAYTGGRQEVGAANATINRELAILKRAFRLAEQAGKLLHRPFIPMLAEDNVRTGFFERAEFEAGEAELPDPINDIARFGYLVGWRKGRILPLTWTLVDREAREIRPPGYQPNNKKTSIVGYEEGGEIDTLIERRWKARWYKSRDGEEGISEYVFCWSAGHRNVGQRVTESFGVFH